MIGQVTIGKSFGGVLRYVMEKDQAEVLDQYGARSENAILATHDFNAIRIQKPALKNAVWHTSISFAYDDHPGREEMITIGQDYIEQIGLSSHQYLMVRHHDTQHDHLHIVANRVGFNGEVVSDKYCKNRTARVCDKLEEKYKLTVARDQGINSKKSSDRIPLKKQIKSEVRTAISTGLRSTSTFEQLFIHLEKMGIKASFHSQKTGRINGISFRYKGMNLKGSAIDKSFSFRRLSKRLSHIRIQDKDQDNDKRRKD